MNKPPGLWGFALDNLPLVVHSRSCMYDVGTLMADTNTWISLIELAETFDISTLQCGRVLEHHGWRDRRGQPTSAALDAQAAQTHSHGGHSRRTVWSRHLCSAVLTAQGYKARSRKQQVRQWAQFLEAMAAGSPSINATADQLAEDVPQELVTDVNDQLAARGSRYRIAGPHRTTSSHPTAC